MMKSNYEQSKIIRPAGRLTIQSACELKNHFMEELLKSEILILDLSGITEIDLACIQLFAALKIEAQMQNKSLSIKDPVNPKVRESFILAGFIELLRNSGV